MVFFVWPICADRHRRYGFDAEEVRRTEVVHDEAPEELTIWYLGFEFWISPLENVGSCHCVGGGRESNTFLTEQAIHPVNTNTISRRRA